MITKYFKFKTQTDEFKQNINKIISELKNKTVLVCGGAENFTELNNKYKFTDNFTVVGFVNFFKNKKNLKKLGIRTIDKKDICNYKFDFVLIAGENSDEIYTKIGEYINTDNLNIKILFEEKLRDGAVNLNYLMKHNFDKTFQKLKKKLEGKKVLFYGGGLLFQLINQYYDLSDLQVIGVVDKKLCQNSKYSQICGYKVFSPEDIVSLNPDFVVVSTKQTICVLDDVYNNYLKHTKIKLIPLVNKNIFSLIKEDLLGG